MYTPPAYAETDTDLLHRYMVEWSFGTLVTHGRDGLNATHLPFLLDKTHGTLGRLTTHIARRNSQYIDLQDGAQALVIFQGPHAYISPSWYVDQQTFPTWNYTAIHARGHPRLVEDEEGIRAVLRRTVHAYDDPLGGPWKFEAMPEALTAPRLQAIVAIHIPIDTLEGKLKLNQDKSVGDRRGVIAALERQESAAALAVAAMMRKRTDVNDEDSSVFVSGRAPPS